MNNENTVENKKLLEDPQENVLKLEMTIEITRKEIWKGVQQEESNFLFRGGGSQTVDCRFG